ncbi:DNA-processing protein DprA [Companilactobacillus nantensis]|nr:DNA-processing protein DprA [Companilactobacillus nantensis]GEO63077.1 DNA processing protein DprA [Companilactobacillus nantensis]
MNELTEFLIRCRMTGMVSNQIMLKITKISINSASLETEACYFLKETFGFEKYNQFLLLLGHEPEKLPAAINYLDEEYPQLLRTIYNPPALLFFSGKIALLKTDCIAIVGAREATNYSYRCIGGLVPRLVNRYTIVSGLAKGVDSWAHQHTLKNNGQTIAVTACGLDLVYPQENLDLQDQIMNNGLVISEYPPQTKAQRFHFPQRNRIIAGLSQKVIITEARKRSGALITTDLALENNREVMAIPGPIDRSLSVGCNRLIEEGATPLINFNNV